MATKETLVLLHGLGMSARVWDGTRRFLEPHLEVMAVSLLGHRGGAAPARRPVRIDDPEAVATTILDVTATRPISA